MEKLKLNNEQKTQCIAHYKRMIDWAKTQDPGGKASLYYMKEATHERWTNTYCKLCIDYDTHCAYCPMSAIDQCCMEQDSIWKAMGRSYYWGEWLIHAEELLELFKDAEVTE